jgi:hypothetical protein
MPSTEEEIGTDQVLCYAPQFEFVADLPHAARALRSRRRH